MQTHSTTAATTRPPLASGSWVFSAGDRTCIACGRTIPTRDTHFATYPRFRVHYCRECMDRRDPDPEAILETVRTAIARRLYVELGYNDTTRTIRPYGLTRTREGHTLVHAIRMDCQELRSYRLDRMEAAALTTNAAATLMEVA